MSQHEAALGPIHSATPFKTVLGLPRFVALVEAALGLIHIRALVETALSPIHDAVLLHLTMLIANRIIVMLPIQCTIIVVVVVVCDSGFLKTASGSNGTIGSDGCFVWVCARIRRRMIIGLDGGPNRRVGSIHQMPW